MASAMSTNNGYTPAMKAIEEAIDLDLEGRSPYPKRARFLDAKDPEDERAIKRALDEQRAVVLVSADGSTRIIHPEPVRA
jgi:hypothetical protein